mgnify:CR=1 FL=1
MNILFVNYGDFTTNSLNHIGGFANTLCAAGHACAVAVTRTRETLAHVPAARFIATTYDEALATPRLFPDGRSADVIHAWTPRESVRKFVLAYQRAADPPARLIIHLEDNEHFLLEAYTGRPFAELRSAPAADIDAWLVDGLPHPLRHESFLRVADGVTHIVDRLREFAPAGIPSQLLPPGVDFSLYAPQAADETLRAEIGLTPGEKVLVFTGSNTFANESEMRELYLAVALLNARGTPVRLVRTGFSSTKFLDELPPDAKAHVVDLGFVEKTKLPRLLALADVLVQPGRAGPFNDYRLPSKLPEFLAMGKPVVLPATNLAALMSDGRDAVFLSTGAPEEIADTCERLFADPTLGAMLGENAVAFARRHFDLGGNSAALADFYATVAARPTATDWSLARSLTASEATILAARLPATAAGDPAGTELLGQIVRQLEEGLELTGALHIARARAERDDALAQHALTRQHVRNVEEFLATSRAHAGNLAAKLAEQTRRHDEVATRLHAANLQLNATTGQLHAAESEISGLKNELASTSTELEATRGRLAEAEALCRTREEKIARMQASFSWQATAPLRAARRALLDRPSPPRPSDKLIGNVDAPADWSAIPATLNLRGWSLHRDGVALTAMRARLGARTFPGEFGLDRADVLEHHRDQPGAARCGWSVTVDVPASGMHSLIVELQDESGAWHVVESRPIRQTVPDRPGAPSDNSYAAWVAAHDSLTPDDADRIRARLASLAQRPLLSVLMPTYNTPEKWLVRAIESVRRQLHENWELCIADDASTAPHVRKILVRYEKKDPRIKVAYRETNGHISSASNSALALAKGEFTALLDHDDEIRPHALAEIVFALNEKPELEFIYSDEDKLDEAGQRFDPYFKPDWNPDLLLGQNYTCHLSVFRTQRLRDIGGFRLGYEGSQDWDLTLRATEGLDPSRIRHIPRVLYHWRAIPGSTALLVEGKSDYPFRAAEKALADHLARTGVAAELIAVEGRHWRVKRALPSPPPRVSIIIPTRNAEPLLRRCVDSLLAKTVYPDFEIIVVNNRSDDSATLACLDELRAAGVRIVDYDAPFNFSALNNFAVREARGPLLAFLNNDLEVISPGWLEEMVSHAVRPEIGAVGAMLYYPNDTVQHAGAILGLTGPALRDGVAGHAFKQSPRGAEGQRNRLRLVQNYSAVTAACLVVRKELFESVGGFNETDLAVAFNDIDLCLRLLQTGRRNLWTPFAEFYHHESASRGAEDTPEKIARFQGEIACMRRTWAPLLDADPAYNPNLTLIGEDFSLGFPPRVAPPAK